MLIISPSVISRLIDFFYAKLASVILHSAILKVSVILHHLQSRYARVIRINEHFTDDTAKHDSNSQLFSGENY